MQAGVAGAPHEGNQLVELDSRGNSGIYQDIATVPGQKYQLQFAFSSRPNTSAADNELRVLWDGGILADLSGGAGGSQTAWEVHSYQVTASGNTTRLEFQDQGTSNGAGTYIDAISLVAEEELLVTLSDDALQAEVVEGQIIKLTLTTSAEKNVAKLFIYRGKK